MVNKERYEQIAKRARLGLPLTERERAIYLLFIASDEEIKEYEERRKEI